MRVPFLIVAATSVFLGSCAQDSLTSDTYSRDEARKAQSVNSGRITSVRNVKIEGEHRAGGLLGGVAGGFLGNEIGSGSVANTAGAVGGALVGSAVGSRVQQSAGTRDGLEITVRLDSGESVSVVQEVNPREAFQTGDRVRLLDSGSSARVTH